MSEERRRGQPVVAGLGRRRCSRPRRAGAAGLPRAAAPRRRLPAPRARGPHAAGDGAGPRGVHAAGRPGPRRLAEPRTLLRRRRADDAADPGGPCARAPRRQAPGSHDARRRWMTRYRAAEPPGLDLVMLDEALTELSAMDARQGQIVELRYFGGLSEQEVADTLVGLARDRDPRVETRARVAVSPHDPRIGAQLAVRSSARSRSRPGSRSSIAQWARCVRRRCGSSPRLPRSARSAPRARAGARDRWRSSGRAPSSAGPPGCSADDTAPPG